MVRKAGEKEKGKEEIFFQRLVKDFIICITNITYQWADYDICF